MYNVTSGADQVNMMNADLYLKLYATLKSGRSAVLIRIVRRRGSAPRGIGSACIIDNHGILSGSIGGGLLEHRAVEEARSLLGKKNTVLSTITLTAKEISDEGMICGGSVELFFEPVVPDDPNTLEFFKEVDQLIRCGGRGTLITLVRDAGDTTEPDSRMLVMQDGSVIGTIPSVDLPENVTEARLIPQEGTENRFFVEPVMQKPVLLLFGGGHISKFVSPLARTLGFHIVVCDDRSDFANHERFPEADELFAGPYHEAFKNIAISSSTFIVIVTRGHGGDKDILEHVLNSVISPAYIGMIGSIRKRDTIYKSLLENGVSPEMLERVYSPIGVNIGAQTPEEIAVSIMAEIIRVKATGN